MNITHRVEDHTYWDEAGIEWPGVTRVLRAAGIYQVNPHAEKERYQKRGKAVHFGADLVTMGEWDPESTHAEVRGRIQAAANFVENFGFQREYGEQVVCSSQHIYAGRFDVGGLITRTDKSGKHVLVDWKSGDPPAGVEVQLALYDRAAEETLNSKFSERWAVWLRDDGSYRIQPCNDPASISVGLGAVWIWHWKKNKGLLL